jgi:putative hemolysin
MDKESLLGTLLPMEGPWRGPLHRRLTVITNAVLERSLGVHTIRGLYDGMPSSEDPFEFLGRALKVLGIKPAINERDLRAIPASGPAIVVANHPFGGIDGIVLAATLASVRKDIKILANYFLGSIPDLRPLFLLVDPFGRKTSTSKNIGAVKRAVDWVKKGGMLIAFPSGEVSHATWRNWKVEDPPWNNTAARLVHLTKAPVLPVHFEGRNSILFQGAGLLHPLLRTVLLPRELLKKRGATIRAKIGTLIPYRSLKAYEKPEDLIEYLRFRTSLLSLSFRKDKRLIRLPVRPELKSPRQDDIVPQQDAGLLKREVEALPPEQKLAKSGEFQVYYARAGQIPRLLQEIGRLREETFRLAGEGTGKAVDLDRFDNIYIHLFIWNKDKDEVVGAYRLGPTDEILPRHGKRGLYTHTLFNYQDALLKEIGPALELGRTFVRKEYQRSYPPLFLLWKGIGRYVVVHPRYKLLFGAVSISNAYQSYSRQLMVAFLKMNRSVPDLQGLVRPRNRFRQKQVHGLHWVKSHPWEEGMDEVSAWISGVEEDGKGMPILLKQYLKLGGKVLEFNVDNNFSKALDGLILVDLTHADRKTLGRYMGDEGMEAFLDYHGASAAKEPVAAAVGS